MREADFKAHMESQNLADKTRQQRVYALKRIEKFEGVDLDSAFIEDGLEDLVSRFTYRATDAAASKPNPTKMDIDQDRLLAHLAWYKSHLQSYRKFLLGGGPEAPGTESFEDVQGAAIAEAVSQTFGLEKDLQSALRANLAQLEDGLVAVDGGGERKVEAGFIDILAKDSEGDFVVIELKADIVRPQAVAQILAYMGCIAEEEGAAVRGILIGSGHDSRVTFAAKAVPNLELKIYRYRFEFE
ncbi:endonuclease NucS domain-containing protein [Brevundimonas sp.]|uniref:endonuclease NucS domain-containing protein n=1 Tax=Brevundimonas sp. TaxID=1871086 RepID=UPI002FC7ADF3